MSAKRSGEITPGVICVSVVVTAHNAAATIGACLRAISRQNGFSPRELEIVLIDDRSSDGTLRAATSVGLENLVVRRIEEGPPPGLTSRQAALDLGISLASAPIVCLTDADSVPSPDWIASLQAALQTGADLVSGPVLFEPQATWLGAFQTVDAAFYMAWCRMLAALGFEGGVLFGNAAFPVETYRRIGGFEAIGQTLTEDLAFARAVRRRGLRTVYLPAARVSVRACSSRTELIERAARTSTGGFSALFATLTGWMLMLPALGLAAWISESTWLWMALAVRYGAGLLFNLATTFRAGGRRALAAAAIYDVVVLTLGAWVLIRTRRQRQVTWGGITYDRQ